MKYSEKVKAASTIINALSALKDGESIRATYGTDYNGEVVTYKISVSVFNGRKSYSINKDDVWAFSGMNISSINKTTMDGYTYDMMGQRTTYRFPLYAMEMIVE